MALWLVWMGKDSSGSPAVRAYKQDWKPLGISRSSDPPSVACAPGGSKSQDFRCFHSHLFLMPDLPAALPPGSPASAPTALPSLHQSLEQGPQVCEPHSVGTGCPVALPTFLHATRLRTEHQIKKCWSLSSSLACVVTVTSVLNTVEK